MSAQGEPARLDGDVDAFADDDPLLSPDDRVPYELTDLARAYLRGLASGHETAAGEDTE